jgi:Arc/MetJ family transcription regulator
MNRRERTSRMAASKGTRRQAASTSAGVAPASAAAAARLASISAVQGRPCACAAGPSWGSAAALWAAESIRPAHGLARGTCAALPGVVHIVSADSRRGVHAWPCQRLVYTGQYTPATGHVTSPHVAATMRVTGVNARRSAPHDPRAPAGAQRRARRPAPAAQTCRCSPVAEHTRTLTFSSYSCSSTSAREGQRCQRTSISDQSKSQTNSVRAGSCDMAAVGQGARRALRARTGRPPAQAARHAGARQAQQACLLVYACEGTAAWTI